ncbi:hypothetical protein QFZ89_004972 [Paraburkholderia youngii]
MREHPDQRVNHPEPGRVNIDQAGRFVRLKQLMNAGECAALNRPNRVSDAQPTFFERSGFAQFVPRRAATD